MFKSGKPLKLGTTNISNIKLGGTNITKIYLGTNIVFNSVSDTFYFIKNGVFQNGITSPTAVQKDGYIQIPALYSGNYRWVTFTMDKRDASQATSLYMNAATSAGTIGAGYFFSSPVALNYSGARPSDVVTYWNLGNVTSSFQTYVFDRTLGDELYFSDQLLYYGVATSLLDLRIKDLYLKANLDLTTIMRPQDGEVIYGYFPAVSGTYWEYDPDSYYMTNYIRLNATGYSVNYSYTYIGLQEKPINFSEYKKIKFTYDCWSHASNSAKLGIFVSSSAITYSRGTALPSTSLANASGFVTKSDDYIELTIDISNINVTGHLCIFLYSPNIDSSVTTVDICGIELYKDAI